MLLVILDNNVTMNRIQKEINNKQTQLDEVKEKNERLQEEVERLILIQMITLKS